MYNYNEEKKKLYSESGMKRVLSIRDSIKGVLKTAGAFQLGSVLGTGDAWQGMAVVDLMVEMGEIREVTSKGTVAGQHRVFVAG